MKTKHLFLDFSMLGYHPEYSIMLDCSVAVVDAAKMISAAPYTTKTVFKEIKRFKLSIADQKERGYVVCPDGLEFWKTQPSELIARTVKPSDKDLTIEQFTTSFIEYLIPYGNIDAWWSWNNMDDASILWRLFCDADKEAVIREYLPRWKSRDMMTFIDSKFDFELKKLDIVPVDDVEYWNSIFVKNDSRMEVMSNILRMQAVLRAEKDLENVKR